MFNFSIKDSLIKMKDRNYEFNINETIDIITNNLDEEQLRVMLMNQGLKLDNNIIRLHFMENIGFRCFNEKSEIYGKLPICRNIENFMNSEYSKNIK